MCRAEANVPVLYTMTGLDDANPFEFKQGSGDASIRYKVFAPTGYQVFDERFVGVAGGLGQAFRAVGGNASWQPETRAMSNLGADSVNIEPVAGRD